MGARLYSPTQGLFTSPDSAQGGGATSYGYPFDPANAGDLNGKRWMRMLYWSFKKGPITFKMQTLVSSKFATQTMFGMALSSVWKYVKTAVSAAVQSGPGGATIVTWASAHISTFAYSLYRAAEKGQWFAISFGRAHVRFFPDWDVLPTSMYTKVACS